MVVHRVAWWAAGARVAGWVARRGAGVAAELEAWAEEAEAEWVVWAEGDSAEAQEAAVARAAVAKAAAAEAAVAKAVVADGR